MAITPPPQSSILLVTLNRADKIRSHIGCIFCIKTFTGIKPRLFVGTRRKRDTLAGEKSLVLCNLFVGFRLKPVEASLSDVVTIPVPPW